MVDVAIWGKALHGILRMDKQEWNRLDIVARWLIATRAAVLVMTFVPSAIAGLLALRNGLFEPWLWLLTTIGLILAHATNNIFNDITDYWNGVDRGNYFRAQYGVQPLEHGLMSIGQALVYAGVTGAFALGIGLYLAYVQGPLVLALTGVGAFFVLFYTWPLKYIGLGEPSVLLVWGPLMTGGAYYAVTGEWSWMACLVSLPAALGATTVLFGKHIDKLPFDRDKRILTVPVLLGERAARYCVIAALAAQYGLVAYFVVTGYLLPVMAVVLAALKDAPMLWRMYRAPKPDARPDFVPENVWPLYFSAGAFLHTRDFGLLFLLGLVAGIALRALGVGA